MIETILQYAVPMTQGLLIFALFGVAFLFVRLDGKLNAMKKGTDGIRQTIVELNNALAQAQKAMQDLKNASDNSSAQLAKKIEEANAAKEALAFATTTAKAIKIDTPQKVEYSRGDFSAKSNEERFRDDNYQRRSRFDDLPPINENRRREWGGLR